MSNYNEIQKAIITTEKPHVLVCSAAASGKTQTLIGRLKYLLDNGVPPEEIVAITFTNNAASVMYERLGYPSGLFIGTVHSYANFLLRGGAVDTTDLLDQERFDDLFPRIEENKDCLKHVSHLILDEGQDSTRAQFEFFELINPDNYMYFFDYRQSIYGWSGADPQYLIDKMKEPDVVVYQMRQNYRNLPDILRFAKRFLYRLGPDYEDDSIPQRDISAYHPSYYPVVESNLTPTEAAHSLVRAKERLHTNWGDWFVLCRTNADVHLFTQLFKSMDVPTDTFKQADLTNSQIEEKMKEDTVKILTVHSAKGLENKCVLSYNIRAYKDEEARLCYVSATRARDFLLWVKLPSKKKKKARTVNWE